ncbi:sugar ABC transporter permease [Paenibacillus sp.]|uniref:carbohydrate ABC transporter permease n=1 Tax=Paenibacillus sp. TaxID=58172 RepID=UPI002D75B611|nr:sugar ABC transporter permease [Paenibacillus sp.]HZG56698.1 sugar ABC transporter permease [Paenibacillus sp.]
MKDTLRHPGVYALFVVPTLLLYVLFFVYPMATSLLYGFTDWNGLDDPRYVGFGNFAEAFGDDDFVNAIYNNIVFILFAAFVQVPLIVFIAVLISHVKKFQGFYKTTVFVPSIVSTSVIGILWGFIYQPEVGPLNRMLGWVGIEPIYWLADTKWALFAVLATNAWQWMGFFIVLVLAAILAIPKELNEAAEIDGASGWQKAVRITVPLIRPIVSVVIMLSIAGAMKVVDIVLVMTNGGPVGSTEVMASYMVTKAINYGEYGYGTALSIIIFAFALLLTGLYQLLIVRRMERAES